MAHVLVAVVVAVAVPRTPEACALAAMVARVPRLRLRRRAQASPEARALVVVVVALVVVVDALVVVVVHGLRPSHCGGGGSVVVRLGL